MRGRRLVRRDQVVDFGAGQAAGSTGPPAQSVQPVPSGAMRGDVGIDVHALHTNQMSASNYPTSGYDAIVTGEAVALELRVARAGSRMLAFAIDLAPLFGMLFLTGLLLGFTLSGTGDPALAATGLIVTLVFCFVALPVAVETLSRGRSLGKLALGLRVVRDDGGPIRFRHAFVRGITGLFELYMFSGIPALITSLASRQGKRVGDYLAGTMVLQERVPARPVPPVAMPPPLAGWAATADLTRVPDSLALAARQYLGRAADLHADARSRLETQLATAMAAVVAPPPPRGTPGWALLAAVLAERRRRVELRQRPPVPEPVPPSVPAPPATPQEEDRGTGLGGFAPPA
jgi:uncharacterized RDD family membrane protein YckC